MPVSQTWPLTLVCLPLAATSPSLSPCRETLWVLPPLPSPLSLGVPIASIQRSTGGGEMPKIVFLALDLHGGREDVETRPGDNVGQEAGPSLAWKPSSLPCLCLQNAEGLLETAGIKVGCSELRWGQVGPCETSRLHRALRMSCVSYRPCSSGPSLFLRCQPCGTLWRPGMSGDMVPRGTPVSEALRARR